MLRFLCTFHDIHLSKQTWNLWLSAIYIVGTGTWPNIDKQQGVKLNLHIICINFQVVLFVDNLLEFENLSAVYEQIFISYIVLSMNV